MPLALYPGSFDPFHLGHLDVVEVAAALFDRVLVAVVHNPGKDGFAFSLAEREAMVAESCVHLPNVAVTHFAGLVIDLARDTTADVVVKGVRCASDLEIESQMAETNRVVSGGLRTVLVPSRAELGFVSARFIREIARCGRDVSALVPAGVAGRLKERFGEPA